MFFVKFCELLDMFPFRALVEILASFYILFFELRSISHTNGQMGRNDIPTSLP